MAIRSRITKLVNALGHNMVDNKQPSLDVRDNAAVTEAAAIMLEEGTE